MTTNNSTRGTRVTMSVTVYKSFSEIPDSTKNRVSYPAQPDFFLTLDWFKILYASVFEETDDLLIYIAHDAQEIATGLLFCCTKKESRKLTSLTNYYSLEYSPVILLDQIADRNNVTKELMDYIVHETPKWEVMDFKFLKSSSNDADYLLNSLDSTSYLVTKYFQYDNWYYTRNNDDFTTYYNARPSRLRNTIKRKNNSLNKKHSVDISIYRENNGDLSDGINDYITIYNNSWKKPEPYIEFIPTLIKVCANLGILRLGILHLDNTPVAAQIWITTTHKAIIYKLAYNEEYKKLSVGSILSKKLFEIAIDEDKVQEIDYGIGSENYKQEWMQSVRKLHGIEAVNLWSMAGFFGKCKMLLKHIPKRNCSFS